MRTPLEVFYVFIAASSTASILAATWFLINGTARMTAKDIVSASIAKWDSDPDVRVRLAKQKVDAIIGVCFTVLAVVLQVVSLATPPVLRLMSGKLSDLSFIDLSWVLWFAIELPLLLFAGWLFSIRLKKEVQKEIEEELAKS